MKIEVLTLFPNMFDSLKESVIGKALDKEKFILNITDIRDYSLDKHKKCDDYPFGGGSGMVMTPQPIFSKTFFKQGNIKSFLPLAPVTT